MISPFKLSGIYTVIVYRGGKTYYTDSTAQLIELFSQICIYEALQDVSVFVQLVLGLFPTLTSEIAYKWMELKYVCSRWDKANIYSLSVEKGHKYLSLF